jgi:hypothetical protein
MLCFNIEIYLRMNFNYFNFEKSVLLLSDLDIFVLFGIEMHFDKIKIENITNITGNLINMSNINSDNNNLFLEELKLWPNKILIYVYMIIFIAGLVGNLIVIYFVLFYRRMQSMTNKFITNLALSDLLVIFICIPDEITRLNKTQRIYGELFCKITHFVQGICLSVSVMTLTAISIDRYLIINKPVKARTIYTHGKVRLILIIIWFLSIAIMSPLLYFAKYETIPLPKHIQLDHIYNIDLSLCIEDWPNMELKLIYGIFLSCILFFFPIVFMSYAYYTITKTLWFSADKSKTVKNVIAHTTKLVNTVGFNRNFHLKISQKFKDYKS